MSDTDSGQPNDDVYEMLWDCAHCGTKKLLGLSHRHCPSCGAPQNADERYFPADSEKIAVKDHVYCGKDIVCRYCGAYNSRNSRHCRECGAPASEGSDARLQADEVHDQGTFPGHTAVGQAATTPSAKRTSSKAWTGVLIGLGVLVVAIATFVLWKRDASFEVVEQAWLREVDVERFGPVKEVNWCDSVPAGAQVTRTYEAVRTHEKVPAGEDCKTRKIDRGDGTFAEQRECTPRYESRPVKADKCDYTIDRWSRESTESASGKGTTPAPSWPEVNTGAACTRVGCRRAGEQRETYSITLRGADGQTDECDVSVEQWASSSVGKRLRGRVRVLGGGVDCDSLTD